METIASIRTRDVRVSSKTVWNFVIVTTSEGRIGVGEASVPSYARSAISIDQLIAPLVGTALRSDADGILNNTDNSLSATAATCAVDQAFRDLDAQARQLPIHQLFGREARPELAVYANINRRTFDRSAAGFAASARAAIESGNSAVKIAPFDDLAPHTSGREADRLLHMGFERIDAVRDTIGARRLLMIDCHERLNPATFTAVMSATVDRRLFWIESPFEESMANFPMIRRAREEVNAGGVFLAGAELKSGLTAFLSVLDHRLYDVIMPDMTFAGGYSVFLDIAHAAAERGVKVAPHNPWGPICHAHSIQVSAVAEGFLHLESQFDESPLFDDIVAPRSPKPDKGVLRIPNGVGLGLRLTGEQFS